MGIPDAERALTGQGREEIKRIFEKCEKK